MEIIANISPLILDVRTIEEYDHGHIANAKLLPLQQLQTKAHSIFKYKDEDIIVYCASGNRSTTASKILIDLGFKKIYNMRYGIKEWLSKGYPIKR